MSEDSEHIEIGGALIEKNEFDRVLKKGMRKMTEDTTILKDYDALAMTPRIVVLGGEKIDVSKTTPRMYAEYLRVVKKHMGATQGNLENMSPEMLEDIAEVAAKVCAKSSQKIDKDFLLDEIPMPIFIEFLKDAFSNVGKSSQANAETGGTGKN